MFPVAVNAAATPAPATLVATSLPENFAQRVPSTNVSPSVSSVQINNNARGNGAYAPIENGAGLSVPVIAASGEVGTSGNPTPSASVPAAFLAQLIGQQVPASLQGTLSSVLVAYDQLVANSFVKYKPSNATLPPPPPSGVFGKFLAQENPPAPVAVSQPAVAEEPQQLELPVVAPVEAAAPIATQQSAPEQQVEAQIALPQPKEIAETKKPTEQLAAKQPRPSSAKVAVAYLMSAARIEFVAPATVKDTA
jgi:hypothetical protein